MIMISNNNKGNPNHDENGKFTSNGNNYVGGGKPQQNPNKVNANTGNQAADFASGLWNSYMDNQGEEDETSKLLRMLKLMNGDLDEEDQEKKELVEEAKQQNELDTQEEAQGREEEFDNVNAKLGEMGFGDSNGSNQVNPSSKIKTTPEQDGQINEIVNEIFPGKDWKYLMDNTDSPRDIRIGINDFLETGNKDTLLRVLKELKDRYAFYRISL